MNNKKTRANIMLAATVGVMVAMVISSGAVQAQDLAQQGGLSGFVSELLSTIIYSVVGIVMGVVGFKVVDWLTPGNLAEEVAHKENRALAVLAGSMMLGVCIIIAAVLVS